MNITILLIGVALGGMALLATHLGLDHDPTWGIRRLLVLMIGCLLIALGLALHQRRGTERPELDQTGTPSLGVPFGNSLSRSTIGALRSDTASTRVFFAAVAATVIVVIIYVWFVSVGYWTFWPKTTYTYDLLASAFSHGMLSLEDPPDPALLRLSDPYDPAARQGIQYPWDASLFQGRYYLYWGPVPGLILAGVKLFYAGQIADQYLVFAFVLGTFISEVLLLFSIWRRFFRETIGAIAMIISALVAGLMGPATWLLSRPAGYEAAIAGGQFFFIAGLYFACSAVLYPAKSTWRLALAGASWALAVGSRAPTAIPIAFLAAMLIVWLVAQKGSRQELLRATSSLIAPLAAGAVALAWYNWQRFGSIAEFGLRYQLSFTNLNRFYAQAFSVEYVRDNLRNYLVNPIRIGRVFPFLVALPPQALPAGPAQSVPQSQIEPVTGLLFNAPFLLLAAIPVFSAFNRGWAGRNVEAAGARDARLARTMALCLLAASVLAFVSIVLYFFPTMRQLEDVVPSATLLAVLGFWQGWRYSRPHPSWHFIYALAAAALAGTSIVASCLLAITSYDNRFLHLNRDLLRLLIHFFAH